MFVLSPLGDVSSFRRKGLKNEVYLITEDKCIECSGVLLAARSPVISELLETSQNIPATEFSDNIPGLEDCLDLIYGSSIQIGDRNYKTIYKFGKIFQIKEMMDGILSWVTEDLDCEKFWEVYLELITLNVEKSVFLVEAKRHLTTNSDTFLQCASQIFEGDKSDISEAVTELLSEILDKRILNFMVSLGETALENYPKASSKALSCNNNKFLVAATSYIEQYVKSDQNDFTDNARFIEFLNQVSRISSNVSLVRTVLTLIININARGPPLIETSSMSTRDLNCEIIKKLIDPRTSLTAVQHFAQHSLDEIHPCIIGETVAKWASVRNSRSGDDVKFLREFYTTIQNMNSQWYLKFCNTRTYVWLNQMVGLNLEENTEKCNLYYFLYVSQQNSSLRNCIEVGDGTPINLPKGDLKYSESMEKYAESIPAFRYNPNVVPQYGNIEGHWLLLTENNNYVSFITESQQHILQNITNCFVYLVYVPLDCGEKE